MLFSLAKQEQLRELVICVLTFEPWGSLRRSMQTGGWHLSKIFFETLHIFLICHNKPLYEAQDTYTAMETETLCGFDR